MTNIGKNVSAEVTGNTLTILVDLTKNQGRSASGKSIVIATTNGNVRIDGTEGAVLGFNLYRKA